MSLTCARILAAPGVLDAAEAANEFGKGLDPRQIPRLIIKPAILVNGSRYGHPRFQNIRCACEGRLLRAGEPSK